MRVEVVGERTPVRRGVAQYLAAAGMGGHESVHLPTEERNPRIVCVLVDPQPAQLAAALTESDRRMVLVLEHPTPSVVARAVRDGAAGVVDGAGEPRHLVQAVRAAAAGYIALPLRMARDVVTHSWPGDVPSLLPEDLAVMRQLAAGGTVAQVARDAGVSQRELQRWLEVLFAGLGVGSRIEAAVFLAERGLLRA